MSDQAPVEVSVIIPCYNYARYLPQAVASVVAQTCGGWELLIVDDGSQDESLAVAQELRAQHVGWPIRVLTQTNGGLSAARNSGAAAARGVYLLFLDADDMLAPDLLARALPVLRAHPEVGFVYSGFQLFGDDWTVWPSVPFDLRLLRLDNYIHPPALTRRSAWEQVGGFDPRMPFYEDWDFWLRLAAAGWSGHHLDAPLVYYRRHGDSLIGRSGAYVWDARAHIIRKHPDLYGARLAAWAAARCARDRLPRPRAVIAGPPVPRELPPPETHHTPPQPFATPDPAPGRVPLQRRLVRAVPFGLRFRVKCWLRRLQLAARATGLWDA
ncbi:MAG TPA: glycosyltransferase [Roseiflexaceae bacterium]|nr:glycosyltransferase [Roseiflexaceae bacterium]